jgi:glycosyltransferase involved in cell wall biosynthesis
MRVLHVYSGNLFGGIESILLALAHAPASRLDHEFALCFHGRLERELMRAGATIYHLGAVRLSRPASVAAARRALSTLLRSTVYERVICHAPWAQGLLGGVVRRAEVPLVFWAHDLMTGRHWTEKLARRTVPGLAVCNSRFTAGTLGALYPNLPAAVVYAPVEGHREPGGAQARRLTRAALDTPDDAVVIASACRSERWKGHLALVEALSRLDRPSNWVWWQVGGVQRPAEARFIAAVKQAARRLRVFDRIRWIGERDDVPALLAAADVYCQPNLAPEPFGVVFVEALAAGLPVVTSAIGGALEIVDQSCGRLVPPGDPIALASALRDLIGDPAERARLARAGPERARQLCEPAIVQQRLFDVLSRMPAAGSTRAEAMVGA